MTKVSFVIQFQSPVNSSVTRIQLLLLVLIIPLAVHADDAEDVISCLGVSPVQFDYLWTTACDKKWEQRAPAKVLENTQLIPYAGIGSEMLEVSDRNANTVTLKAGPKCDALQKYYFDKRRDAVIIADFIEKDRVFIEQYGYSALDARGTKKYQSASMNGRINEYELGLWLKLEEKGLIKLSIEDSTFNGMPSRAYFSSLTQAGKALNDALRSGNHSAALHCPSPSVPPGRANNS